MGTIGAWLGVLVLIWLLLFSTVWLLGSRTTDRRHLTVGRVRRGWRSVRSAWLSTVLTGFGWPHVIDVLLRTKRTTVGITPSDVVWTSGSATLRRYEGRRRRTPILVVHSMITEPWILDLCDGHSLIGYLVGEGHDVYLLDWGAPGRAQATHGLAEHVRILREAERVVLEESGRRRLDLVGYCLGALICLIRAATDPSRSVRSIVAIAPPIDVSSGGKLGGLLRHRLLRPAQLLDADACVPAAVVRETFHALRPQALRSVALGWRLRRDATATTYYGAMARWAWEQRRLSGAMFLDLVDLYRSSAQLTGALRFDGVTVDLSLVECPVLVLVAQRDHIVPEPASAALETTGPTEVVTVPSGHVSMIVGSGARDSTWPTLTRWFKQRRHARAVQPAHGRS